MNLKHLKSKNYSNESIKIKADLGGCSFDLSEQRIPKEFYDDFIKLAKEEDILGEFKKVYDGVPVNITENRSVSHFRYRDINISHEFKEHQTNLLRVAKEIRDQSFEKIIFFPMFLPFIFDLFKIISFHKFRLIKYYFFTFF